MHTDWQTNTETDSYIFMRRHTHTHTHTHMHTRMHTRVHACFHMHTIPHNIMICAYRFCTHACSHMHPHTHRHTHTHTCTHSDSHMHAIPHIRQQCAYELHTVCTHVCMCMHTLMHVRAHTHTHTNTQHRQPKSRSARLYSLLFARLRCISDARGRNGDTNDDDSDNQDPVLASALAYLSELKEKLNVYRLTGENLAGSIISWSWGSVSVSQSQQQQQNESTKISHVQFWDD